MKRLCLLCLNPTIGICVFCENCCNTAPYKLRLKALCKSNKLNYYNYNKKREVK